MLIVKSVNFVRSFQSKYILAGEILYHAQISLKA